MQIKCAAKPVQARCGGGNAVVRSYYTADELYMSPKPCVFVVAHPRPYKVAPYDQIVS